MTLLRLVAHDVTKSKLTLTVNNSSTNQITNYSILLIIDVPRHPFNSVTSLSLMTKLTINESVAKCPSIKMFKKVSPYLVVSGTNCLSGEVELCLEAGRLSGSSRRRGGRVPGHQGRHELGGRAVRLGRAGRGLCGGPPPGGRGQGVTVDRVGRDGRKRRS